MIKFRQKEYSKITDYAVKMGGKIKEGAIAVKENPGRQVRKLVSKSVDNPGYAAGVGVGIPADIAVTTGLSSVSPGLSVAYGNPFQPISVKAILSKPSGKIYRKVTPIKVQRKLRRTSRRIMKTNGETKASRFGNWVEDKTNSLFGIKINKNNEKI